MRSSNDPNQNFLQIHDVYKSYGSKLVLDNVDLEVKKGELCTLVGPSGCGKSTLLRLIVGAETPSSGTLRLSGKKLGTPDINRGIVFQRYSLYPHLTIYKNVSLGLRLGGRTGSKNLSSAGIKKETLEILERVRLIGHENKYPHQLSGGMQQRVAIAQSLIMKPKILLMDEPFGALDPDTREDMQLSLIELWEQENMTIFFVTHDLDEAAFLGSRILVLSQYYTDDRGNSEYTQRGAKIVADHQLPRSGVPTSEKYSTGFADLIKQIRTEGFDPDYIQHAQDFNLKHPDSFRTLTEAESA
jgi:NitT/TauT family transport system ATP-binding protein